MKYSFWYGVLKSLRYLVLFILPMLVDQFVVAYPDWAQLTVGGLLVLLTNFLKVKYGARLP